MRHGHVPTAADWRRLAELMEAAAAREVRYLRDNGDQAEAVPQVGDESWLAAELARAYLGRPPGRYGSEAGDG